MSYVPLPLADLIHEIQRCTICADHLPLGPNPILQAESTGKIALIAQAPGRITHERSKPYADLSGDRLRDWLGVNKDEFYESGNFIILPMGFCYPGKNKSGSGDAPPRPECAPQWHDKLWASLPKVKLTCVIGAYAQKKYLAKSRKRNLTETVKAYSTYAPKYFPMPHPSPLNNRWLSKNRWFEQETIPVLRQRVSEILEV